jgi:hypothetical protein
MDASAQMTVEQTEAFTPPEETPAFSRYAIYWVPRPETPLATFARRWFASEVETGMPLAERDTFGFDPAFVDRATALPRRYGIHATLKAPFRLREGVTQDDLINAMETFCAVRRAPRAGCLRFKRLARYLALVPEGGHAELDWLATECVTHFDGFREPLTAIERARRPAALDASTETNFLKFGYPDIFARFQFQITLAGPLDVLEPDKIERVLAPTLAPLTKVPFVLEDLCLCADPGRGGLFRVLWRQPFR